MDWLNDKKNQRIVAGAAALLIVVAAAALYLLVFRQPAEDDQAPVADSGAPAPEMAPPAQPTAPAPAPGPAAAAAQQAAATPMESWRKDPFLPIGYKPPSKQTRKITPRIFDFPFPRLPVNVWNEDKIVQIEPPQPARRMAGLLLNERIYAIIETNGKSEIVQPGDVLSDRLAVVDRIEPDKVVLKTISRKPSYITVRMAAAPRTDMGSSGVSPSPASMGPMGPIRPMLPPMPTGGSRPPMPTP